MNKSGRYLCIILIILILAFIPSFWCYWELGENYPGSYYTRVMHTSMNLHRYRSAISKYYQEENTYPNSLLNIEGLAAENGCLRYREEISSSLTTAANSKEVDNLDGSGGWYYNSKTGEVRVNVTKPVGSYFRPWFYKNGEQIPSDW